MGYRYNHSDGVNLSVGDPEYLEPPEILGYIVLKYFVWGMGLTNHIIKNMVVSVFHHLPSGGEGKKIWV